MDTLETLDFICYIAETISSFAFALIIFLYGYRKMERSSSWFYYLLAGFFACITLSDAYYLLTWAVSDYPYVFSPGDLSWVGATVFLITAGLGAVAVQDREKRRKYMLPALFAPVICIAFTVTYICIYPDIIVNYLLYGVPTAILSYYMLLLLLSEGLRGKMHGFYISVLTWIGIQLFYDLFYTLGWDYGFAVPAVISGWAMFLAGVGIFFTARKGGRE